MIQPRIPQTKTWSCRKCGTEFVIAHAGDACLTDRQAVACVQFYEILCETHAKEVIDQTAHVMVVREATLAGSD